MPYGLGGEGWDAARLSVGDLKSVFNQLRVVLASEGCVMVAWVDARQVGDLCIAMDAGGFTDAHPFVWCKNDQNIQTGTPDSYTYAIELCVIGYFGGRSKCKFRNFSKNPSQRHNFVVTPTHRDLFEYKSEVINLHEKPISLSAMFISSHSDPGDKVLILGSASGSEMISSIELGRSVVGIELDGRQFEAANARLRSWWTKQSNNWLIWESCNKCPDASAREGITFPNHKYFDSHVPGYVGPSGSCFVCCRVSFQEGMGSCGSCGCLLHHKALDRSKPCRYMCPDCQPKSQLLCSELCHNRYFKGKRHAGKAITGIGDAEDKEESKAVSHSMSSSSSSSSASRFCAFVFLPVFFDLLFVVCSIFNTSIQYIDVCSSSSQSSSLASALSEAALSGGKDDLGRSEHPDDS